MGVAAASERVGRSNFEDREGSLRVFVRMSACVRVCVCVSVCPCAPAAGAASRSNGSYSVRSVNLHMCFDVISCPPLAEAPVMLQDTRL